MSNKIGLQLDGFEELIERLDASGGDIKKAVDDCLTIAQDTVASRLTADMKRHHMTGDTEKAIINTPKVEWEGMSASIDVGFRISAGGLPSVFLMYGTPRSKPDKKIYNDVYGSATRKEVAAKQEEIFYEMIRKRLGG